MRPTNEEKAMYRQNTTFPDTYTDQFVCSPILAGLKKLPDNCTDLILLPLQMDPTDRDLTAYFDRMDDLLTECVRVLKYGGRIAVVTKPMLAAHVPIRHVAVEFLLHQKDMIWYTDIVWQHHHTVCSSGLLGSWLRPSAPFVNRDWDAVTVFSKGTLKHDGDPADVDIEEDEFRTAVGGLWHLALNQDSHAMIPPAIATRLIRLFTYRGDVVVAPYDENGVAALAAKKSGRRYLGIDDCDFRCFKAWESIDRFDRNGGKNA